MKKLAFVLLLSTLTVFIACNRGDNSGKNEILLNEVDLEEYFGYYDDYGSYCLTGNTREDGGCTITHRATTFLFTDGTVGEQETSPSGHSYFFRFNLYTPGESFASGTYSLTNELYNSD